MRGKELLTPEQRNMFMSIPEDITEHDMEIHYTFTSEDLEFINKHRRDHNRLGIALQLAVLQYPGWTLFQIKTYLIMYLRSFRNKLMFLPRNIQSMHNEWQLETST